MKLSLRLFGPSLAFGEVLETLFGLMIRTNKYIDDQAPWKLAADQKDKLGDVLLECLVVVKTLAVYLHPFMPTKTQEIWDRLGEPVAVSKQGGELIAGFRKGKEPSFNEGQTILKGDPLFMRKGGRWK